MPYSRSRDSRITSAADGTGWTGSLVRRSSRNSRGVGRIASISNSASTKSDNDDPSMAAFALSARWTSIGTFLT